MYVLAENEQRVLDQVAANPLTPIALVEPLVIRANAGEVIQITFTNKLSFPAGIHCQGVEYNPNTSDGAFIGNNLYTLANPGETANYIWKPVQEGIFGFSDLGNPLAFECGSNIHGLFGALVVEAEGSTWTDSITGGPINSGKFADIHNPNFPSYREFVIIFQDEQPILDKNGNPPIEPLTGKPSHTFTISYRSEPSRNRLKFPCPNCVGEESALSSWPYGDPATPIPRAYKGDQAKFKILHAGVKETHGFHLHTHQWRIEPNDPNSSIIDAIAVGPQQSFILDILHGAGSLQGSIGDSIWHCHLYPHFDMGMWGLWRVIDKLEDGFYADGVTPRKYPDGTPIPSLRPLPGRPVPPKPTFQHPGYPLFIPGTFGRKAPKPPAPENGGAGRVPAQIELDNLPFIGEGTAYVDPIPPGTPVRFYDIVAIEVPLKLNRAGWHDPQGRILCLAEDEDAIKFGHKDPEPLVIRANAGEGIHIRFTNKLPVFLGGNAFQELTVTNECGCHVHLVKFDVLVSDGGANGWNYDSGSDAQFKLDEFGKPILDTNENPILDTPKPIHYKWYADRELRACFFHDHFFPNSHQQHGYFACCVIEPAESEYLDVKTGLPIASGTKAIIKTPYSPDFREFVLFEHDFIITFDANGNPVNPPPFPSAPDDFGTMAFNYRNEPFQFRNGADPAYVFCSYVHGDPYTPLLEAYHKDPISVRLLHGAHEEQHTFNVNCLHWKFDPDDPHSGHIQGQTLTLSEQFDVRLDPSMEGCLDTTSDLRDYLYWSGGMDDLWLGMWGIIRIHNKKVPHLFPLSDNPSTPTESGNPLPVPNKNIQPPKATDPGMPWPVGTKINKYKVVALQKDIVYNQYEDHDPHGMIFVLAEQEAGVRAGRIPVRPLVLRVNEGESLEVTLINKLNPNIVNVPQPHPGDPPLPVPAFWPMGARVSMCPQLLHYWVRGSDGSAVGFNPDSTVGPGEAITYRWWAPHEHGIGNLWSFGDLVNHRHHGLWGAIITESKGSKYLHPRTLKQIRTGTEVVISNRYIPDFREFVVFMHNGLNLYDKNHVPINDDIRLDDPEDRGEKGFNYRSEALRNRVPSLQTQVDENIPVPCPDMDEVSKAFSSSVHEDPATPVFDAYLSDPVRFRVVMPADKPRNQSFLIHGHLWPLDPMSPTTNIISCQGSISVGKPHYQSRNFIPTNSVIAVEKTGQDDSEK
ncbi:MAG: multicopper oxidase domain-containing protein [Clostridia bacterium]|nr:multicopper oxidase domain-containing protein [Clostridia bacterium]